MRRTLRGSASLKRTSKEALAWLPVDAPAPEALAQGVWVTGTNYSNGREVALQLHLYPGIPAETPPCP